MASFNAPVPATSLRRSWLFLLGTDTRLHTEAMGTAADALISDFEDGTAPPLRPAARRLLPDFVKGCHQSGKVACVRINPLATDGKEDVQAVLAARPDAVLLPKTESPEQVCELAALLAGIEWRPELVPNIETAAGLVRTLAIASAHPLVTACLVASEDMTTSLGAERSRAGVELQYARSRFLVECRAAGVVAIDCPYTFSDVEGLVAETRVARRLGYGAKSAVDGSHVAMINELLTPGVAEVARAREIVARFDAAHAQGQRAEMDGNYLEVPIYLNAKRLLERSKAFDGRHR